MNPQSQHAWLSLLLFLVWLLGASACVTRRREVKGAVLAYALGTLVALVPWGTDLQIPNDWLVPLQEVDGDGLVRLVHGEGAHGGMLHARGLLGWITPGARLNDVAAVHLGLGLGAFLAALPWCIRAAGATGAVVWWAVLMGLPTRLAMLSEGPAPLLWWVMLVGFICWTRGWLGWAAWLCCSMALALSRPELLVLPLVAVVWRLVPTRVLEEAAPWAWLLAAVWLGGGLMWLAFGPSALSMGRWSWAVSMLHPFDPAPFYLIVAASSFWPIGVGLLLLAAFGTRDPWSRMTGAVLLSTLLLAKAYHAAGHGGLLGEPMSPSPWEMARYLGFLVPCLLAITVMGARAVLARGPQRWWGLLLLPGLPVMINLWPGPRPGMQLHEMWAPRRALQQEVRWIREVEDAHGTCVFLMPTEGRQTGPKEWWRWTGPELELAPDRQRERRPQRVVAASEVEAADLAASMATCSVVLAGRSCARPDGRVCSDDVGTHVSTVSEVWPDYAHPAHKWARVTRPLKAFRRDTP
ncbi:MAG: hypothetical protein ACON5B_18305 [Myxococcota bacterium]